MVLINISHFSNFFNSSQTLKNVQLLHFCISNVLGKFSVVNGLFSSISPSIINFLCNFVSDIIFCSISCKSCFFISPQN